MQVKLQKWKAPIVVPIVLLDCINLKKEKLNVKIVQKDMLEEDKLMRVVLVQR